MSKSEFIETAKECGYTDTELVDLLELHDELGITYDEIPLLMHNVD